MPRRRAFTLSCILAAIICTGGVAAVGRNIAAAAFGAFGAAAGIALAYWAMRDWLREEQTGNDLPWFAWSPGRRAAASTVALLLVAGSIALGPLISWVLAVALVLIIFLGLWVMRLALRS
jgi:hypothetical protein